jgi:hypothetical protein
VRERGERDRDQHRRRRRKQGFSASVGAHRN